MPKAALKGSNMRIFASSINKFQVRLILCKIDDGDDNDDEEGVEEEEEVKQHPRDGGGCCGDDDNDVVDDEEENEEETIGSSSLELLPPSISDSVSSERFSSRSLGNARTNAMATADNPAAIVKTMYTNSLPPHKCNSEDPPLSRTSKPT